MLHPGHLLHTSSIFPGVTSNTCLKNARCPLRYRNHPCWRTTEVKVTLEISVVPLFFYSHSSFFCYIIELVCQFLPKMLEIFVRELLNL